MKYTIYSLFFHVRLQSTSHHRDYKADYKAVGQQIPISLVIFDLHKQSTFISEAPVAQLVSARYLYDSAMQCWSCEFEPHLEIFYYH